MLCIFTGCIFFSCKEKKFLLTIAAALCGYSSNAIILAELYTGNCRVIHNFIRLLTVTSKRSLNSTLLEKNSPAPSISSASLVLLLHSLHTQRAREKKFLCGPFILNSFAPSNCTVTSRMVKLRDSNVFKFRMENVKIHFT